MKPLDSSGAKHNVVLGTDRARLNSLAELQNQREFLDFQATWKLLYRRALKTFYLQAVLTVALPIGFGAGLLILPAIWDIPERATTILKAVVGFYGLLIVLIDDRVLDQRQQRLKKEAATAQEMFDRGLFQLSWGRGKPEPLDGGRVKTLARRWYKVDRRPDQMRDWYPVVIAELPLYAARVVAQRCAISWDADLRARYVTTLQWFAIVVFVATFLACLTLDLSLADSLVAGATATPILRWAIREERRQKIVQEQLAVQGKDVRALWSQIVAGQLSAGEATVESRDLQDAIFERRRSSPLGFPWLYKLLRHGLEEQMVDDAEDCVVAFQRPREPGAHG